MPVLWLLKETSSKQLRKQNQKSVGIHGNVKGLDPPEAWRVDSSRERPAETQQCGLFPGAGVEGNAESFFIVGAEWRAGIEWVGVNGEGSEGVGVGVWVGVWVGSEWDGQ